MPKEITPEFIGDIQRKFILELDNCEPLFIFSKTKKRNGEQLTLNFFEGEYMFAEDLEVTAHQREILTEFIELANEILSGNIKPRIQYPVFDDVEIYRLKQ